MVFWCHDIEHQHAGAPCHGESVHHVSVHMSTMSPDRTRCGVRASPYIAAATSCLFRSFSDPCRLVQPESSNVFTERVLGLCPTIWDCPEGRRGCMVAAMLVLLPIRPGKASSLGLIR